MQHKLRCCVLRVNQVQKQCKTRKNERLYPPVFVILYRCLRSMDRLLCELAAEIGLAFVRC